MSVSGDQKVWAARPECCSLRRAVNRSVRGDIYECIERFADSLRLRDQRGVPVSSPIGGGEWPRREARYPWLIACVNLPPTTDGRSSRTNATHTKCKSRLAISRSASDLHANLRSVSWLAGVCFNNFLPSSNFPSTRERDCWRAIFRF